jgi:hypothetical protein
MSDTAAIELIKRAIQLDDEQKYPDALTCYSEGIRMLLKAVKGKRCLFTRIHIIFLSEQYET